MDHPRPDQENMPETLREGTKRWLGRTLRRIVDATRGTVSFRLKPITGAHDRTSFAKKAKQRQEEFEHRYPFGLAIGPLYEQHDRPHEISEAAARRLERLELIRRESLQKVINQMVRLYGLCPDAIRVGEEGLLWVSEDALRAIRKDREHRQQIRSVRKTRVRRSVKMEMMKEMEMPLLRRSSFKDKKASATLKVFEAEVLQRFSADFESRFQNLARANAAELDLPLISLDQFGGRVCPIQIIHERIIRDEKIGGQRSTESRRVVAYAVDKDSGKIGLLKLIQLEPTVLQRSKMTTQTSFSSEVPAIPELSTDAWMNDLQGPRVDAHQTTKDAPIMTGRRFPMSRMDRFDREARALRTLAGEGAPVLYHASRMQEWGYLFMECVPKSQSLLELFQQRGKFPIHTNTRSLGVLDLVGNVAVILDRLHREKIIHQDVKPANILYQEEDGFVYLVDFGGGMTRSFAPPEALDDFEAQDERSDLFALGSTAYYLLSGMDPFGGFGGNDSTIAKLTEGKQVIPLSNLKLDIPPEVCALIEWMLQRNPDDRPQSANEVLCMVDEINKKGTSMMEMPQFRSDADRSYRSETA